MIHLLNLHLWQEVHCRLPTAQCKLHTALASAHSPSPEPPAPVHFILHTGHCTPRVYTAFQKCMASHCKYSNLSELDSSLTWQNIP